MLAATVAVGASSAPAGAHTPHDVIVDVAVSPAYSSDRTVLTISDNRVLRSTDGGLRFRETTEGLDSTVPLARFGFAPSDPRVVYLTSRGGGVYRSDDGGLQWRSTGSDAAGANAAELSVSPRSPDVVVVREGLFGGLVRTDDGGRSWAPVPALYGIGALVFVPGRDRRVVAGDSRGQLLVSDDDGLTFRVQVAGPGASAITAFAAGPSGTLFAGTKDGSVLRSDDGGDTWAHVGRPLAGPPINSLVLSRTYARDRTVWASTWHRGVFRSTDAGRTWTAQLRGLTTDEQADTIRSPQFRSLAAAPRPGGGQRLFLAGYDGLFESNNDGTRWAEIQTEADYVTGLAVSPDFAADHTVVVNTYVKGSYISRDRGAVFTASDRGLEQDGLAEGNKLLPLRRLHNVVFSPDYRSDHTIFTATWTKFVKSVDGGRTWKSVVVAPPPPETELRQFVIAASPAYGRDHTIFLGTRQGDLYRSTRGGDAGSWTTAAKLGGWIRSLAISPAYESDRTMFAGTDLGVMQSTDGGQSWTRTGPDELALLAMSPSFPTDHTLFAGTRHGVQVTRDGGRTWTATGLGPRTPPRAVAAVSVSPAFAQDGTVLASVDGTGLFRSRDRGRTFAPVADDLLRRGLIIADFDRPTSAPIQFSRSFARDRTIFSYAQESVLRSTDGGNRWSVLTLPSADSFAHDRQHRVAGPKNSDGGDPVWWVLLAIVFVGATGVAAIMRVRRRRRAARVAT